MVLNTTGFACVYWIHLPNHKDFLQEGYIGISSNPSRRWKEHSRDARGGYHPNNHLGNAILKYKDDLIYDVIFAGTIDQCYEYEKELRPTASIGWNLMGGGKIGKLTEEALQRLRTAAKNRKPPTDMQKWRRYNKRYQTTLTFMEYKDMIALKNEQMPPSKANMPIFDLVEIREYTNLEEASKTTGLYISYILASCENKTGNYIFMKDL